MAAVEHTHIKVAVRVRPYNGRELELNQRCIIKVMDSETLLFDPEDEDDEFFYQGVKQTFRDITKRVNKKLSMEFDHVFDQESTNMEIFQQCTAPLVDSVLNGYNGSVFVYGATGAGKTYTMLGNASCAGLTFLTMRDLFEKMKIHSDRHKFDVGVSYLEVYNEHVMNLLTKTGPLKLREDSHGVVVSGLNLKPIFNAEELLDLLALGNSNRTQHPTDANAESSRSHAVFQVHIRMTDIKTNTKRTVKLSMIDLAGSERASSTKGIGVRFKEGASINKSLLALGNCINKLADGNKHIPYRDSNLTRILKDSLGGNCRTLMVANISMSSLTYEDTYNTLKYASRAKKIRTTVRQNVLKSNMPKDFYVKKVQELMDELDRMKEANKSLVLQRASATTIDEAELRQWYTKIDLLYTSISKVQECITELQSKIKSLRFRTKITEDSEQLVKKLTLSKEYSLEDVTRYTEILSRLNKQIERDEKELLRWRKKQLETYKDLEKLKRDMRNSKYANILQIYEEKKKLEVWNNQKKIGLDHISTVTSEVVSSSEKMNREFVLACEIMQESYQMLKKNYQLSTEMEEKYEQLRGMINSAEPLNGCKTYRKTNAIESDEDLHKSPESRRLKRRANDEREVEVKRAKWLPFDDFDLELDPVDVGSDTDVCSSSSGCNILMAPHNLNVTHVVSNTDIEQLDSRSASSTVTVTLSNSSRTFLHGKNEMVNNILSEQIAKVQSNKDHIKSALLKSKNFNHHGLLKVVATGLQKENKKFSPHKIRKSPRAVVSKGVTDSNLVSIKKPPSRMLSSRTDPPVRINRAAAFRTKK